MKKSSKKVPVLDIAGLSAFQHLHGNTPEMVIQGDRIVCLFDADDTFFRLASLFNENSPVNVLDFRRSQRQLNAMMVSLKSQGVQK